MSRKIFKLCLIKGFTEAYYQLSEQGKKEIWEVVGQGMEKAGSKRITPYYLTRWSNETYQSFFIMEYPDIEGAIADMSTLEKADWTRYLKAETILGYEMSQEEMDAM